ncbi:hypothetical protein AQUCO_00700098v1 [Aquilegia coerulea]|uniref:Allene oxide synthase n=1 Tax=Aquilegia coerulea TaxID=218851 RepID=A0A2G5EIJ7_AQUCA|nr:hypothetical protein AQUCO_00700098v1 [Aquilegia coerulea]
MSSSISSSTQDSLDDSPQPNLPLRKIPGTYGLPFFGAIKDRLQFFYYQGRNEFFNTRMSKYNSTIFRINMPPGPFIANNPKVIVLLDAVSFPVVFDLTKVEKKNVLATYSPYFSFFGGYHPCAYQDPSEPTHNKIKQIIFSLISSRHDKFISIFQNSLNELFNNIESQIAATTSADFSTLSNSMAFEFLFRSLYNTDPKDTKLGTEGQSIVTRWLSLQLAPLVTLGLPVIPDFIEDMLLRTIKFPFFPAKSGYKKLYDVIYEASAKTLDEAEQLGLKRDEACHNLIFMSFFNAYGAMTAWYPILIKWIGLGGEKLHKQLSDEIRAVVLSEGGEVTMSGLEKMTLTKSAVYEAFRIEPPVRHQYATAKKDLVVQNHESSFEIKKGELILGYQPFATNDPKIFENPETFKADRFVGEKGEKLLKYVYWSNGRETENATVDNKQCPGKDMSMLLSRLMVVELFLRYDTFGIEVGTSYLGPSVTVKSMTAKATKII